MKYFAYASDMLAERLMQQVHGARCVGIDESGRCDIPTTGNNSDVVYGVLFHIAAELLQVDSPSHQPNDHESLFTTNER